MIKGLRKNGRIEVHLNEDKTQAIATIYPPEGGMDVDYADVAARLESLSVTYGIREEAIKHAITTVASTKEPLSNIVVAEGAVPVNGIDAKLVVYVLNDILTQPLPKRKDLPDHVDWFAVPATKLVRSGFQLASVVPPQPGVAGKTLTWPIQNVQPRMGMPCRVTGGENVRASDDNLRFYAAEDGCACMHGDRLDVTAIRVCPETITTGEHAFTGGAILHAGVRDADVRAGTFIAIKGSATGCRLRADTDIYLTSAEECVIVCSGSVYVTESLRNCDVSAGGRIVALENAIVSGGSLCACDGVSVYELGGADRAETRVEVGIDRVREIRKAEMREEMAASDANILRIAQALKSFVGATAAQLSNDKRLLLQKLLTQKRSQEERAKVCAVDYRAVSTSAPIRLNADVTVVRTAHPGVSIRIRTAQMDVTSPLNGVRFHEGGKQIRFEPLQQVA